MATTRGWAIRGNVNNAINYILDLKNEQTKTNDGVLIDWSGQNTFSPYSAGYRWQRMKMSSINASQSDIEGYHFQQSFEEGSVTPEEALDISREWIEKITGGNFDYVMAVHTNTANIHTHIIVNPLGADGKLWNIYWKNEVQKFRKFSDEICKKHDLDILEKSAVMPQPERVSDITPAKSSVKQMIEYLLPRVSSYEMLVESLNKLGYRVFEKSSLPKEDTIHGFEVFTVNKVLFHVSTKEETDKAHEITIRFPYRKDMFMHVPPETWTWMKEGANARICLAKDKMYRVTLKGEEIEMSGTDIKQSFHNVGRNIRIIPPGFKKAVNAESIKSALGKFDFDSLSKRQYGEADPQITNLLRTTKYRDTKKAQREILEAAGIKTENTGSSYLSQKQENYYRSLIKQAEARRNQIAFEKLLSEDRNNLPLLRDRKKELLSQIDEINEALKDLEERVAEMENDILSETGNCSEEEIDSFVKDKIHPLLQQKESTRSLIEMYTERIIRVQENKNPYRQYNVI